VFVESGQPVAVVARVSPIRLEVRWVRGVQCGKRLTMRNRTWKSLSQRRGCAMGGSSS
jgi:hypothetical protein